jgi:tetratricopeptide (TPR) repeat protein
MHDLMKVLGKEDLRAIGEELGFQICEMDDIHAIVIGSFTKAGDMFVTEAKVLDVRTKKLLKSTSSEGQGVASILKTQIDELSKDIARGVSRYERVIETTDFRIMEVTTNSMEAYNYFLRGRIDYEKYYFDDARRFLEKAVEIDSTFASAYLYLARAYEWLGDYQTADRTLKKALTLADRATEKERFYIEECHANWIEKNPDKGFHILNNLIKKYPKEKNAYVRLGVHYQANELYQDEVEVLHKVLELDPHYGVALRMIAYGYMDLNEYEKAIEYFKRYAAVEPADANPFDSMGDLYFRMGRLDDAILQYKEALFVKPDFYFSSGNIAYIYALRENYAEVMKWIDHYITTAPSPVVRASGLCQKSFYSHLLGKYNQALSDLDSAEALLKSDPSTAEMGVVNLMRHFVHYYQGKLELSNKCLKEAYPKLPDIPGNTILYNFLLASIELKQGKIEFARTRYTTIDSLLPEVSKAYKAPAEFCHNLLYAEILLVLDSLEKSGEVFRRNLEFEVEWAPGQHISGVHQPFDRDVGARVYYKKGDINKAIMEYERLLDPNPNKRGRSLIRPTWRYELAKLYEEEGLKAKAIRQYGRFLDIWKDADEDRFEKIDAQKRLKVLEQSF